MEKKYTLKISLYKTDNSEIITQVKYKGISLSEL